MAAFQYTTTYRKVPYLSAHDEASGFVSKLFQSNNPPAKPDIDGLYNDPEHHGHLETMGKEGWRLVTVTPILKGAYSANEKSKRTYAVSYPLTDGFMYFWEKEAH